MKEYQTNLRHIIPAKDDVVPPCVMTPTGSLVVIHQHPPETNTNGIYIPDGAENPAQSEICTVIAVGPECKQVRAGDKILMLNAPASQLYHRRHKYIFVKEEFVACVLDPVQLEQTES